MLEVGGFARCQPRSPNRVQVGELSQLQDGELLGARAGRDRLGDQPGQHADRRRLRDRVRAADPPGDEPDGIDGRAQVDDERGRQPDETGNPEDGARMDCPSTSPDAVEFVEIPTVWAPPERRSGRVRSRPTR
ncbi:MAG: hypothetical protein ACLP50_33915 [Solirubrobacteraceae bacterium]